MQKPSKLFSNHSSVSVRSLQKETTQALRISNKALSSIIKEQGSPQSTLSLLNTIDLVIHEVRNKASLFVQVHPDKKLRQAAEKSVEVLSQFYTDFYLRRDVFDVLLSISSKNLDSLEKRFLEKELRDFRLSGVDKSPTVRKKIACLTRQMVKLGQAFDRTINEDVRYIKIKPEELEGLPDDYKKKHQPDRQGLVTISTQYPDIVPFMQYATSGIARKKLYMENTNRGWPKNDAVFRDLLKVREEIAHLLGFKDWASYVMVDKMAQSPKRVDQLLSQIDVLTKKRALKDYQLILRRKKKDDPSAKVIHIWEAGYYDNLAMKAVVGLDSQEVRHYFSFEETKRGILKSAEQLFGLSFRLQKVKTWHSDVEVYDVLKKGEVIGRFYLDLHPRENKYNHAACFEMRPGIRDLQLPEATLVCNFSSGLMDHSEVTTFFHEFGHLMHFILAGKQSFVRFSGFATEWDFVEAPSQMLESWGFDYDTLKTFARHSKTRKVISREMVKKLEEADNFGKGIWQRRQLFFTKLSLEYHRKKVRTNNDLLKILRQLQKRYSAFGYVLGTHSYASFGHLNGYSAIYYTYLWSRAIAEDILGPFRKKGMYNRKTADKYINSILAPGGSEDAADMLRSYLGREWNLEAFHRWLNK